MRLGSGDGSLLCGSMTFLKEMMDRRAAEKDTTSSLTASPVSAKDHGPSDDIDDILMGGGFTGTGVSKAKDVSESESCTFLLSLTSAGVVANVTRRDASVGLSNKAKGRGFIEYNTVHEQTPINADIEHFVHTISAFAVLLGISFLIIGYTMGPNIPEGLLLIGRTLTLKRKQMLATNLDMHAGDKMGTLTPNNLMNGTASPAPMICCVVLCCFAPPPHHHHHHVCTSN